MEREGDKVLANPWLASPAPTARLPKAELEERILNLLSSQNMCVLATAGPGGPLATPVRYYHLDFTVVFTAQERSPKLRNIAEDPRVSVVSSRRSSDRQAVAVLSCSGSHASCGQVTTTSTV